jgi:carboxyl-terminal processing protease
VSGELDKMGIDWAAPPDVTKTAKSGDLEVKVDTGRPNDEVVAGESMDLKVTVKNKGSSPVYRLRAQTESENGYFDAKELVFGKIAPGEERTAKVPLGWCEVEGRKFASIQAKPKDAKRVCKIPLDAVDRSDGVAIKFEAEGGEAPPNAEVRPTVRAEPRPVFKYSYEIIDDRGGNGDGRIQRGEKVSMYVTLKNVGKGRSFDTQATLTNLSGDGLMLQAGRFDVSNMKVGDAKQVVFTFDVANDLADPEAVISLTVSDRDLNETAKEKVKIPIEPPAEVTPLALVRAVGSKGATLLESPKDGARSFGRVTSGTALDVVGRVGAFDKVKLEGSRFAFVASSDLGDAGSSKPDAKPAFEDVYAHAPPELTIEAGALSTRAGTVKLKGSAVGATKIQDIYGFVGGRKVFYQSNKDAKDPKSESFDIDVQLKPGVNIINVFAREDADSVTRRMIVVRKDGESGEILKTPKGEDADDWLVQGGDSDE